MRSDLVKAFRSVDPLVEGGDDVDLPFLVRHDPAQYRVTDRPRASAHVPESYGSPQYRIHCGEYPVVSKLSGACNQGCESTAQKAAQGAPRARTVAVHQAT